MQIYHYHPITGDFLSIGEADECQLVPGDFHIPAFATEVPPPIVLSDEVAVFLDGGWVTAVIEKPVVLEKTKEQFIQEARQARDAAVNSDIEVFGVLWQVDTVARDRMQSTIETAAAISAPPETLVNWILSDSTIRPSTAGDLQQVLVAYTMRLADIFQQYVVWMNSSSTEMFLYTASN